MTLSLLHPLMLALSRCSRWLNLAGWGVAKGCLQTNTVLFGLSAPGQEPSLAEPGYEPAIGCLKPFDGLAVELHPNLTQDLHPILTHPI